MPGGCGDAELGSIRCSASCLRDRSTLMAYARSSTCISERGACGESLPIGSKFTRMLANRRIKRANGGAAAAPLDHLPRENLNVTIQKNHRDRSSGSI